MSGFINKNQLISEAVFKTSRSSGAGGQHVNKVNTKVELRFDINKSQYLNEQQKNDIYKKLSHRITSQGELIITSDISRSQLKNKEDSISRFLYLIDKALTPSKKRMATKPSYKSIKKRLELKQKKSEKKALRKKPKI